MWHHKDQQEEFSFGYKRGGEEVLTWRVGISSMWKYLCVDNKVVNVANTLASPTDVTTVKRMQKDGTRLDVSCPLCVALCNQYMGGVNYNDQLRGSYHVRLKCMKNYKNVFWYLFDVSVTNARILHSFDVHSGAHMHFRLRVAEQLIGSYMSRKRVGRPRKHAS